MAYIESKGNLFDTNADTIVNTVNCVGVMGKGVALEFRRRFPEMYESYREECMAGRLKPGDILFYAQSRPRVLSLAVKNDWKYPSKYEWVESCLRQFRMQYRQLGIESIAFPWIGAMNGRLDWSRVHDMMRRYLGDLPDIRVEVVEFDAKAPDPLFNVLSNSARHLGASGLSCEAHIPESGARIICDAVTLSSVASLAEVCDLPGLGKVTIERLYEYVRNEPNKQEVPQLSLF